MRELETQSRPRRYRQIHGMKWLREESSILDPAARVPVSVETKRIAHPQAKCSVLDIELLSLAGTVFEVIN